MKHSDRKVRSVNVQLQAMVTVPIFDFSPDVREDIFLNDRRPDKRLFELN